MQVFYSHGKLLLTAEYLVLDGAKAFAIPTKKGQRLKVYKTESHANQPVILWKSYDHNGVVWFECILQIIDNQLKSFPFDKRKSKFLSDHQISAFAKITQTLVNILETARQLNPDFLQGSKNLEIHTELEFDRQWGLGTSSTLINNIAQWAEVNAFDLLQKSFGGSGYDIACAQNSSPVLYTRANLYPTVEKVTFNPEFKTQLFFVYRNQKQDSKASIFHYESLPKDTLAKTKAKINRITEAVLRTTTLLEFEVLITEHEEILSHILNFPTVKSQLFSDYPGAIKSLGGWGGDFILATGTIENQVYFKQKGFTTIIPFSEMCL